MFEAVKRAAKSWWKLDYWLGLFSDIDDIKHQHDSDEARLKALIELFLLGEGDQPSWKSVIHALHGAGESQVAYNIESYAEAVQGENI